MKHIEQVELVLNNGEKQTFDFTLGVRELMEYEKVTLIETGKEGSFLTDLEKIQKGSMTHILLMMAVCIKDNGKSIGMKRLDDEVDIFQNMQEIMNAMARCIKVDMNIPADKRDKGKRQK
ncbi:hypothetical protein GMB34_11685 [Turicibacter sanguinis]|nr:hypothetical protein [Turicibacter sanguinis]MTN84854.1 hypothetical protein [Turicibacter sanguinis]MTN87676.1 hypothetical protein [Turicibacter sanguinis]MTN90498.1 hypothetical protein [Turicibacter sanguinis]MTN93420.1 hypothetical protein [Turicibacter sanguinis]